MKKSIPIILVLFVVVFAVLWRFTPLADYVRPSALFLMFKESVGSGSYAPLIAILVFTLAGIFMVPVTALIIATALLFTFWNAVAICIVGALVSTVIAYFIGQSLGVSTLLNMFGNKVEGAIDSLGREGVIAVMTLRLLPIAPFAVINLALGALKFNFWHMILGSLLGMLPGIILINYFETSIVKLFKNPAPQDVVFIAVSILLLLALFVILRKWSQRQQPDSQYNSN